MSALPRGPAVGLLLALAAGAFLRLWGVSRQIFLGDEIHGVVSAVHLPVSKILTTYRLADHCIPLSALYRFLMDHGVRLSEEVIRAPAVLSGLAALVLFPLAVARWPELTGSPGGLGGWRRAAIFAWLLAVSPSLVYYSRFARPYAEVVLLAPLAVAAFWRWWRGGGHRWAALYALAGAASGWFFLGSAPFVAAPLAWAAGDLATRRVARRREGGGRGLFALAGAAAALAAGMAAFLLPALPSFLRLMRRKAASAWAEPGDLAATALLQAGTSRPALAVLFWGLAVLGLAALLRRRPALGGYTLLPVLVQWAALLVLRPSGIGSPVVLNRYTLVTLPIVLLWVAEGMVWLGARLEERWRARGWAASAVALASTGALILGGPYAHDLAFRLGSFGGATLTLASFRDSPGFPESEVPAAYRQIAAEPGDEPVVEAVVGKTAIFALQPTMALARIHGRPVILVSDKPWRSDPRLAFHTVVPPDPRAIEGTGGRFVVLQLDSPRLRRIERALEEGEPMPGPTPPGHESVVQARQFAGVLTRAWGEPHLVSEAALVWDLARLPR